MPGNRFWIIALVIVILGMTVFFVFEDRIFPRIPPGSPSPTPTPASLAGTESYKKALDLFKKNLLPEAETAARKAVDEGGDVYSSRNLLGLILAESGRYDEAVSLFQANANAWPENPLAYSNAGEALRLSSRPADAIVPLQRAAELAPETDFYQFKLRLARIEAGQDAEIASQTEKELKKNPPSSDWLMTAAAIALTRKNWKEASIILKQADQSLSPETMIEFLKDPLFKRYANQPELAKTFPKPVPTPQPGPITQEALLALAKKDYAKALELIAKARQSNEAPTYIDTVTGAVFMSQENFPAAAKEFQKAAGHSPKDPGPLMNLGQALRASKKPQEAVLAFQKALFLSPRNEIYAVKLAFALIEAGQAGQVLEMKGSGPLLIGKAAAAARQNDLKTASALLKKAQDILPPEMLASLLQDPVFQSYRHSPELKMFFPAQPAS